MNEALIMTIAVLAIIVLLVFLSAINSKGVTNRKKASIYEKLGSLKGPSDSQEAAIRRDAIIKLDTLLSKALQYRYSNEKSCGENLKLAKKIFKRDEYNNIWEAHKLRNKVVHSSYDLTHKESTEAYKTYKISISKILR